MSNESKALVGFLIGVSAGVVAGMLLAPRTGEDTRRMITDRTTDFSDDLEKKLSIAVDKLSAYTDSAIESVTEAVNSAKISAESASENARAAVADYEAKAKQKIDKVS